MLLYIKRNIDNHAVYRIVTSPFLVSAILVLPVFILFKPSISEYTLDVVSTFSTSERAVVLYHDFNKNGDYEKVFVHLNQLIEKISLLVHNNEGGILDQWNFQGRLIGDEPILFTDIDGDSIDDILVVTLTKESINLSCFNPITGKVYLQDEALIEHHVKDINVEVPTARLQSIDLNSDGVKEVIITLSVGFSLYPRRVITYDIIKGIITVMPNSCAALDYTHIIKDSEGIEMLVSNISYGNCSHTANYSDQSCWIMVLTHEGKFKFEPIKIGRYPSKLDLGTLFIDGNIHYLGVYSYKGVADDTSMVFLCNQSGEIVKKKFNQSGFRDGKLLFHDNMEEALVLIKDSIITIDNDLNIVEALYCGFVSPINGYYRDADHDGIAESIIIAENKRVYIFKNKLQLPTISPEIGVDMVFGNISVMKGENDENHLYIHAFPISYLLEYKKNNNKYLQYAVYPGSYLILLFIVISLNAIQRLRIRKKRETERKISMMQLKLAQNQIEPHFTLNLIQSISYMIECQKRTEALGLFDRFSKLLRDTLTNFENLYITLDEEVEYCKNYLYIQEHSMNGKLSFTFIINDEVSLQQEVPKMLLYTFVENAVKHGIRHKLEPGNIEIHLYKNKGITFIEIIDDGIGRAEAVKYTRNNTGKGITILKQLIECFWNDRKRKISYIISDGIGKSGTRVVIEIRD